MRVANLVPEAASRISLANLELTGTFAYDICESILELTKALVNTDSSSRSPYLTFCTAKAQSRTPKHCLIVKTAAIKAILDPPVATALENLLSAIEVAEQRKRVINERNR